MAQGRFEAGLWQPLHCFEASFDPIRLLFENYLPIHGVLFRRTLPGARPRFDETFDLFEDWDFWLQTAAHGAFAHVPGVSARYVVSGIQQSDVFSESATAQATRARLFEKWRHRTTPELHAAALQRLQGLYREVSQAQAQVSCCARVKRTCGPSLRHAKQNSRARRARSSGLKAIVAAREQELANAASQVVELKRVVAERDREVADAAAHAVNLQGVIAERDREVANAVGHAAALERILARRQEEIVNATAEIGALRDILAARDGEIAEQARALKGMALASADKDTRIADLLGELAELHAEGPVRALKRTLKSKLNGPR